MVSKLRVEDIEAANLRSHMDLLVEETHCPTRSKRSESLESASDLSELLFVLRRACAVPGEHALFKISL